MLACDVVKSSEALYRLLVTSQHSEQLKNRIHFARNVSKAHCKVAWESKHGRQLPEVQHTCLPDWGCCTSLRRLRTNRTGSELLLLGDWSGRNSTTRTFSSRYSTSKTRSMLLDGPS
jgi:hypothetical protein